MIQQPFPVIFSGHGSPMLALQHNDITRNLSRIGGQICSRHGTPRAILAISRPLVCVRYVYPERAPAASGLRHVWIS